MSVQIKDRLSQMLINIKDNIDSIPEDTTTDRTIEQAPIFDELAKQINVPAPLSTKTQAEMPPIKITNVHETLLLENATELTLDAKLYNSEHKEFKDTTEGLTKTDNVGLKYESLEQKVVEPTPD